MTGPPEEEADADEERGVRKLFTVSLYFLNSAVRFLVAIESKSENGNCHNEDSVLGLRIVKGLFGKLD